MTRTIDSIAFRKCWSRGFTMAVGVAAAALLADFCRGDCGTDEQRTAYEAIRGIDNSEIVKVEVRFAFRGDSEALTELETVLKDSDDLAELESILRESAINKRPEIPRGRTFQTFRILFASGQELTLNAEGAPTSVGVPFKSTVEYFQMPENRLIKLCRKKGNVSKLVGPVRELLVRPNLKSASFRLKLKSGELCEAEISSESELRKVAGVFERAVLVANPPLYERDDASKISFVFTQGKKENAVKIEVFSPMKFIGVPDNKGGFAYYEIAIDDLVAICKRNSSK